MKRATRISSRIVFGLWLVLALVLGLFGLGEHFPDLRNGLWSEFFVRMWQLFTFGGVQPLPSGPNDMNWKLQAARVLAPLFSLALGAEVLRRIFAERCVRLRLQFTRGHAIVCGMGDRGRRLAIDLRGHKYVVAGLESVESADQVSSAREGGVLVLTGDATEEYLLERANLSRASLVVALCGKDRTNVEIAMSAHEIWQRDMIEEPTWKTRIREALGLEPPGRDGGRELDCHVHIANRRMRDLLQYSELGRRDDGFNVRFFNLYDLTARQFLADELPVPEPGQKVRLLLAGFGPLGEALIVRYTLLAHFGDGAKPHIIVVAHDARRSAGDFFTRWPAFREVPELADLTFLELDPVNHPTTIVGAGGVRYLTVVAHEDEGQALQAAFELHEAVRRQRGLVHVRMGEGRGIAQLLKSRLENRASIKPFGALVDVCRAEVLLESPQDRLARAVHAGYLEYLRAKGVPAEPEVPADHADDPHPEWRAMADWAYLPEDLRDANRRAADHLAVKLRVLGLTEAQVAEPGFSFSPAQEEILCRMEHHRWCADRWINGWRKGPAIDREAKLHDGLAPWEELNEFEKEKDLAQIRRIPDLLRSCGARWVLSHCGQSAIEDCRPTRFPPTTAS